MKLTCLEIWYLFSINYWPLDYDCKSVIYQNLTRKKVIFDCEFWYFLKSTSVKKGCTNTLCYKFQKQLTFCCIEKRSLMRDHLRSMTFLSNGLFSLLGIKCIKCILKSIYNCLSHWFKFKKICPINFSIFLLHSQLILWTAVECIIIST